MNKNLIFLVMLLVSVLPRTANTRNFLSLPDLVDPRSLRINQGLAYVAEADRIFVYDLKTPGLVRVMGPFVPVEKSTLVPLLVEHDITLDTAPNRLLVNNDRHLIYYTPRGEFRGKIPIPPISDFYLPVGNHFVSTSIGFFFEKMSYRQQIFLYNQQGKKIRIIRESPFGIFGPDTMSLSGRDVSLFPDCYRLQVMGDRIYLGNTRKGFSIEVFDADGRKIREISQKRTNIRPEENLIDTWRKRLESQPGWSQNREWMRLRVPEFLPEFRDFQVTDNRIYVFTFEEHRGFNRLMVMDLQGNQLKSGWVPRSDMAVFNGDRYYHLWKNRHGEWELRVSNIRDQIVTDGDEYFLFERTGNGRTDLHRAIFEKNRTQALTLIDRVSKPDAVDSDGFTPLLAAARTNALEMARKLIEKKADVKRTCKTGYTALHWACRLGYRKMAELLLSAGADAGLKDELGKTPRDLAEDNGFHKIAGLFYPLHRAVESGNLPAIESMLKRNPGMVNLKDARGWTPLHLAERFRRVAVRKKLLELGADPGIRDGFGCRPSDYSASAMAARTGICRLPRKTEAAVDDCVYRVLQDYDHINIGLVRNGEIVMTRSYGNNSLNKSGVYASVSKVVTAMVFMRLLGEGKIKSLDDDIRTYSRKYRNCLPEKYQASPLTFRHLLTHTSGIPHIRGSIWNGNKLNLMFAPGSAHMYTTAGFGVLGELMAEISGISFDQLIKEYIGKPVGASSFWAEDTFNCPGARIHSNILDMARFAAGVINHVYVPADVLYNTICRPWKGRLTPGWGCSHIEGDDLSMGHAGSNGTPRAIILIKPRKKMAVCILGVHKSRTGKLRFLSLIKNLTKVLEK